MSIQKDHLSEPLDRASLERLAGVFRAFGDATRLALLQELKSGAKNVNELQATLGTSQANVSRQLKVLHEAGLLSRERRGSLVFYEISEGLVMEICEAACRKLNREMRAEPPRPLSFGA
ncbi:MAG: ArsR/SmtB family transcription factor [Verrucomicrobiales bacterium]